MLLKEREILDELDTGNNLYCKICNEKFDTGRKFENHVNKNNTHKQNVEEFLEC